MLDELRIALIDELFGETLDDPCLGLDLSEQPRTAIRADRPTIQAAHHRTSPESMKFELFAVTLGHPRRTCARVDHRPGGGYMTVVDRTPALHTPA